MPRTLALILLGIFIVLMITWIFGYANYLWVYWRDDWESIEGNSRATFLEWILEHGLDPIE